MGTEVILWCVLGGIDVMLMAGTMHNAMKKSHPPPPRMISHCFSSWHYARALIRHNAMMRTVLVGYSNKSDYSLPAGRSEASNMTTDSEDADSFDQLRTLCLSCRHRNHSSSSSECSCESCISHSDDSFFEGDEGPPGGENTVQRRLYMWLENAKLK
ncbi:hypothetical protein E2C01_064779 [Portunus trituberculatus]|uniref:Uncharacterized protein n=1 Tax=Portunus trituberculatus TaxID=210409 RepID=A0A5B7HPB2_PORTR|nr:hypothetical protein [Portunus trituberculatus]